MQHRQTNLTKRQECVFLTNTDFLPSKHLPCYHNTLQNVDQLQEPLGSLQYTCQNHVTEMPET